MSKKKVNPFIIGDFETGGLSPVNNPVCEFAAIAIHGDTLEEIARFESYVQPYEGSVFEAELIEGLSKEAASIAVANHKGWIYSKGALDVTGITREEMESGLSLKEFSDQLFEFLHKVNDTSGAYYKPIFVGHNVGFDIGFMQQVATLNKRELKKVFHGQEDYKGNFQVGHQDTMYLGKMQFQADETMANYKLATVIDKCGLQLNDAHRAMNDVIATKELFVHFVNTLRNGSAEVKANTAGRVRSHFQF